MLHTAEGATTYQSLGAYFQGDVQASSHVGIDDTPGVVGEYVDRTAKAWTAANANPVAVQAELCAFAAWDGSEWQRHPAMLANTAAWVAEEAAAFGLPVVKLTAAEAQGGGRGVCQHNDLGAWGGGHWDCGPGFPIDQVLDMARGGGVTGNPWNGGQEGTVSVCAHPNGKRIDSVFVGVGNVAWHYWSDDNADPAKMGAESLDGYAKSASCCWLDGDRFVVQVHGSDDAVWQRVNTRGVWDRWTQIPGSILMADPYG